mgnify:CR=1 FL=1
MKIRLGERAESHNQIKSISVPIITYKQGLVYTLRPTHKTFFHPQKKEFRPPIA